LLEATAIYPVIFSTESEKQRTKSLAFATSPRISMADAALVPKPPELKATAGTPPTVYLNMVC
jgi:hypothetical protein